MWKTLAALPVPIFLMVIFSLAVLPTDTAFEQPSLLLILNTLVISGASFAVTYLSLRGYLASGAPGLLLLGPGVLWVGVSSFAAAWLIDAAASPNAGVTIHNIGVFLGSALHLASAAGLRMPPTAHPRRRKQMAGWALILVPLSVALVAMASLKGVLPPFFVPGAGPTPLRQAVLGGAIGFFAVSGTLFMRVHVRSGSTFFYWYSLALWLFSVGLFGVFLAQAVGSPLGWAGRAAQYAGSAYFLVAVWVALREVQARQVPLERAVTALLHVAKETYETLVESIPEAIVSCDREGRVFLWNAAAERLVGCGRNEALGSSV